MNKSPAFQWYPKDILASARVQMMTLAEEGAYRRLLDFCWINGSIPADPKMAARLVGKGCSVEIAVICLDMFESDPNDNAKMIHERLEEEREKQLQTSAVRKKASGARWNKQGTSQKAGKNASGKQVESESDANAMQMDMQNDALHSSSSLASNEASKKEKTTEAVVKKKPAATATFSDDDFLTQLSENAAYKHISVRIEFEKAKIWCANNNRAPTRKFFINWLNRIQSPMNTNGANNEIVKATSGKPTDAGTRNARRISNTNAAIAELRRQAAAESKTLPG